jgi:Uma2 family endonuclease
VAANSVEQIMSLVQTIDRKIEYPESDAQPMGETDMHIDWMVRIRDILRFRYQGQKVYVGTNLLVYYVEGAPSKFVVPDDFVVKDCDPHRRRTFKIWEEGKAPNVVFEVTSRSSRREDRVYKPEIYARLGVREYFLYDPTDEYLEPPLQGFRLQGSEYVRIEPDKTGAIKGKELSVYLRLDQGDLVLSDAQTGDVLMTRAEAAEAAREAADAARKAADVARDAAQARAAQLEAEIKELKKKLQQKRRNS